MVRQNQATDSRSRELQNKKNASEFVVVATPVSSSTGTRSFCVTSDGVIRFKAGEPMLEMILRQHVSVGRRFQ